MELIVDGASLRVAEALDEVWRYDDGELRDPLSRREGRSVRLRLDCTAEADRVFAAGLLPDAAAFFNASSHEGALTAEGTTLCSGQVVLCEASPTEGYRVELRTKGVAWAHTAARTMLSALPAEWSARLSGSDIGASWSDEAPVVFLPVIDDAYEAMPAQGLDPVERMVPASDYHPFLRIGPMVRTIVEQAGYRLESRLLEREAVRSLCMSGAYASSDTTAAERRMGFFARRTCDVEAEADYQGRVYASPYMATSTLGNFVDALSPLQCDDRGEVLSDVYVNGGCLRLEQERLVFVPPVRVRVAFVFGIRYTTDYRIADRERLTGFDSFYLGGGSSAEFRLTNRFADRRGSEAAGRSYRVMVFGAGTTDAFRLCDGSGAQIAAFVGRTTVATTPDTWTPSALRLERFVVGGWQLCTDDWALYDGHVGETGRVDVEAVVESQPEQVGPSSPRGLHTLYLYGAEPGMRCTLLRSSTLGVRFTERPGTGQRLEWSDVARHGIRQGAVIEAVARLFNLRIFTDEQERCVYAEPEEDFYDRSRRFDWRAKVVAGEPVAVVDRACSEHESRLYGYCDAGGATARAEDADGLPYGAWRARTESQAALSGEESMLNPLLAASVTVTGVRAGAPSAAVVSMGDRDASDDARQAPRLVSFRGLVPLDEGECWGWPAPPGCYPSGAFHLPEQGMTLWMGDRDGVEGLGRYYRAEERRRERGRTIACTLRLTAHEVEGLCHRSDGVRAGIDSIFLIGTCGAPVDCVLRRIEEYDPDRGRAKCLFETFAC